LALRLPRNAPDSRAESCIDDKLEGAVAGQITDIHQNRCGAADRGELVVVGIVPTFITSFCPLDDRTIGKR
jgi:hypothetical protein